MQQPPLNNQREQWHSNDAETRSGNMEHCDPAKPAPACALFSADSQARLCSPPEPPPPTLVCATSSDCWGQAARAVSGVKLALRPQLRCQRDELGKDWLPDAPSGCHPPGASQPCGPGGSRDPVLRPCEWAQGESVGHWIDAALADAGWGEGGTEEGAQRSMWGGCFGDSDDSEALDPMLVDAGAEARRLAR